VADMVAMGTVMSMSLCGGKKPAYRPGRLDATQAGVTTGVPAPETDLPTTLEFFSRAGFNGPDSIRLTACGHTMGSVHHVGYAAGPSRPLFASSNSRRRAASPTLFPHPQ
jgi:hypothetical protein